MPNLLRRTVLCATVAATLVAAPLVSVSTAVADPAGAGLVIAEAYLKGGSANQPFTNKFVEIANPTDTAVAVDGWSIQYRAAANTGTPSVGKLAGTVPAHGSYLVQMGSNGTNGQALPTPDAVTGLNPSGSTGTLVLSDQATALTLPVGSVTTGTPGVVDLLGYGTSNTFETAVAPTGTANSVPDALHRDGTVDTDSNAADFALGSTVTRRTPVAPARHRPIRAPPPTPARRPRLPKRSRSPSCRARVPRRRTWGSASSPRAS